MHIRTAVPEDGARIKLLYQQVVKAGGALARREEEITDEYVGEFMKHSFECGLIIVIEHPDDPEQLIGEMHGYKIELKGFSHVLSDVTLAIHPQFQGKKLGRTLLTIFLEEIGRNHTDIGKVELMTGEFNKVAILLYQSMGFKIEGRLEMRYRTKRGAFEADIPMSWQNPNFEFD